MNTELLHTATEQQRTEQKFQDLKTKIEEKDWNSSFYLNKLANEVRKTDLALAERLMLRADNLNKLPKNHSSSMPAPRAKTPVKTKTSMQLAVLAAKPLQHRYLKSGFFLLVILPSLLFALYQTSYAAKRYESRAQLIVQQPDGMATMDASMALLSGFGIAPSTTSDAQLVKAYIHSKDMLDYLVERVNLNKHYLTSNSDVLRRLSDDHTQEDLFDYYKSRVNVEIDSESAVILVSAQAYTASYAKLLTETIVQRAEWYINQIGNKLAEHQLSFIKDEHLKVEAKLSTVKNELLRFQEQYNLLDPEAEGMALQQITYGLEAKLAEKQSELSALTGIMSNNAPQVKAVRNEVRALQAQLAKERARLSNNDNSRSNEPNAELSVGGILAKYAELKIALELGLKAFASSEISLEKARMETYRKLKHLVVVESPTLPEDNQYPNIPYNITLFTLFAAMLYGIGRLLLATVKEIK